MSITSKSTECISNQKPIVTSSIQCPSISSDSCRINRNILQENFVSNNDKSVDQNLSINKTKLASKHISTPSLGEISNDSDFVR
jgi:hypothetical protein